MKWLKKDIEDLTNLFKSFELKEIRQMAMIVAFLVAVAGVLAGAIIYLIF